MARVLLAAQPTAGHTNALRAIGYLLRAQGHLVRFAVAAVRPPFAERWPELVKVAAQLPQAIAGDGFELTALRLAPEGLWHAVRLPRARGLDELELALKLFSAGAESQARQLAQAAAESDVVVGDYLMPGAMLAAKVAGKPYVAVYHSALPFPAEGASPFGSGLPDDAPPDERERAQARLTSLCDLFEERLSRAARALGIERRTRLFERPISEHLNLLLTVPALEPGLAPLEGPIRLVGPCLREIEERDLSHPCLQALGDRRCGVYVSFGTVFNEQPRLFGTMLDALADQPRVVVSAGGSFKQLSARAGPNVHLFAQVPQLAVLERVQLVVTHGGNNTVQETLAAGLPMVVVPFGSDQLVNARRVERLGAGASVLPGRVSVAAIRAAVARASRPEVVARAQQLGRAVREGGGTAAAVEAILGLARSARPAQ